MAATVLAEAEPEGSQDEATAWVYYTFVEENGEGKDALNRSSAFRLKQVWFKVWMVALGDPTHADEKETIRGYSDTPVVLKDYVASKYFQQSGPQRRADNMVRTVQTIYADPSKNPYKGMTNQGSAGYGSSDLNRDDSLWKQARQYHWLKRCGELAEPDTGRSIEILTAKNKNWQTVLFNASAIAAYFKKHPEQLSKSVEKYTAETDRNPPCEPKPAKK